MPPKDGESVAIHQLSQVFQQNGELTVLAMETLKHPLPNNFAQYKLKNVDYHFKKIDTTICVYAAFFNLFTAKPYIVTRFYDKSFEQKLITLLKENDFDVIHLETVFLGVYIKSIKKYSKAKIVLRAHNVEHEIWQGLAENETNFARKIYLQNIMNRRLKKYEETIATVVDAIIPISSNDATFFQQQNKNTQIIEVAHSDFSSAELPLEFKVGFLGGMDWLPNINGVQWFLENVWKNFVKKQPKAEFHLAGRNFPERIKQWKYPNLHIHGEIESAKDFIHNQSLMIAPILEGSGMRVKIVEAMGYGRTVLSTRLGACGIAQNEDAIYCKDNPIEWINALSDLYENHEKMKQMGENAQALIKKEHALATKAEKLMDFYSQWS
ncbi:MAG: glycosyltransferase family 4 protein [Chitinophagales bacterium]